MRPCSVEGCERELRAHALCATHYAQVRNWGEVRDIYRAPSGVDKRCSVEGCARKYMAKGFCCSHYRHMQKHGETREIGRQADWYTNKAGYVARSDASGGRKKQVLQHRVLMEAEIGRPLLPYENVHHINGVRDDNRLENLELWSTHQPKGQRVTDKIAWAKELLALYEPSALAAKA